MRIEEVEEENLKKLEDQNVQITTQWDILTATTVEEMWRRELDAFEINYKKYVKDRQDRTMGNKKVKKKKKNLKYK
jgi:hypothetical protein